MRRREAPICRHKLLPLLEEFRPAAKYLYGASTMRPVIQGACDGLCGLYCIINAIRLVMAPHGQLSHEDDRALFTAGVRFLARNGKLPEAVHSCVSERVWPQLAKHLVARAQLLVGRKILLERLMLPKDASVHETLRYIETMIISGKAPCIFLRGSYRHYSVISGFTPASLKLFDSYGYHWLRRRYCGTTGSPTALHRIHVQSIIALTAP